MLLSSSNTFWAISCLYVFKSSFNLGYFILIICIAINAAFNPESIVTVATGIPFGIWTIDNNESIPSIVDDFIGNPTTGINVDAAITPDKCAAFPAAAIITSTSPSIDSIKETNSFGVLWADKILTTTSTPYFSKKFIQ